MRERFRREAELLARISGAHVAQVYECGATPEGDEYIVMDRLAGEDLATRLRRCASLPLNELVPLVNKIAAALEAAHAAGVVHRDLKPENVFLMQGTDSVRLLDFGIARFQEGEGLTLTMEVLGTPGYLTPEQVSGDGTRVTSGRTPTSSRSARSPTVRSRASAPSRRARRRRPCTRRSTIHRRRARRP